MLPGQWKILDSATAFLLRPLVGNAQPLRSRNRPSWSHPPPLRSSLLGRIHFRQQRIAASLAWGLRPITTPRSPLLLLLGRLIDRWLTCFFYSGYTKINMEGRWNRCEIIVSGVTTFGKWDLASFRWWCPDLRVFSSNWVNDLYLMCQPIFGILEVLDWIGWFGGIHLNGIRRLLTRWIDPLVAGKGTRSWVRTWWCPALSSYVCMYLLGWEKL